MALVVVVVVVVNNPLTSSPSRHCYDLFGSRPLCILPAAATLDKLNSPVESDPSSRHVRESLFFPSTVPVVSSVGPNQLDGGWMVDTVFGCVDMTRRNPTLNGSSRSDEVCRTLLDRVCILTRPSRPPQFWSIHG